MLDFGVQTFTIRHAQKKDIRKAYMPLIRLGIRKYEVARIDFNEKNANIIKELVDGQGIEVVSIQVKPKYVFDEVEKIVRFCEITGCKSVVISMLPFGCILGSEEKFYKFLDSLDKQYDIYASHGITLAYHHHNWEYVKLSNGKTRMEELLLRTEKIKFVHDTYWTARSGTSPVTQIKVFGDRLLGIHMRDLSFKARGLDVLPVNCAIGGGVVNFAEVISAAESVGCSYYVIEQKTDDPYSDIEKSYLKLKEITEEKE